MNQREKIYLQNRTRRLADQFDLNSLADRLSDEAEQRLPDISQNHCELQPSEPLVLDEATIVPGGKDEKTTPFKKFN